MVDVHGFDWFKRTFKGISAGDVFSLPLSKGYGFGRVLNAHDGATIAEFFRYWAPDNQFHPDILTSGRLFSPVGILITDIGHGRRVRDWTVISKDPNFYPDDLYEIPFAQSHDGQNWTFYTLKNDRKIVGPVSIEDIQAWAVASQLPQHKGRITKMVEETLRAINLFQS